jgi:hypothetical protein
LPVRKGRSTNSRKRACSTSIEMRTVRRKLMSLPDHVTRQPIASTGTMAARPGKK